MHPGFLTANMNSIFLRALADLFGSFFTPSARISPNPSLSTTFRS